MRCLPLAGRLSVFVIPWTALDETCVFSLRRAHGLSVWQSGKEKSGKEALVASSNVRLASE